MKKILIKNARCILKGEISAPIRKPHPDRLESELNNVLISATGIEGVYSTAHPHPIDPMLEVVDAEGKVLMPSFVDCHTHSCWSGDRVDEWNCKLAGKSYLDILRSGGGIMSTVRAVRDSNQDTLTEDLLGRLESMLAFGTTTVEVKSGYGLRIDDELKMLRAIQEAGNLWCGRVVPTACIGHAIDPGENQESFVTRTIDEVLPAVSNEFPGIAIDAYCENGAWSLNECKRLTSAAIKLGHPIRIHADQFHSLGMTPYAIQQGFVSVDHLEATTEEDLSLLARSATFGVMLPICGLHVDMRFADGKSFLQHGGMLAIATNNNPGSAPCVSMQMAIALAVRFNHLSPAEALVASTINPSRLLGLNDTGNIFVGQRADLMLLKTKDERNLAYEIGGNLVDSVFVGGQKVI